MPGCGKTHFGKLISQTLHLDFIDLDHEIEQTNQCTISSLFTTIGENAFRTLESNQLKTITKSLNKNTIIACGGGTPCFNDNLLLMKESGIVIYIRASITTLVTNLYSGGSQARPLLHGAESNKSELASKLEKLLSDRSAFYEQAYRIFDADLQDSSIIADYISICLKEH